MVEQASSGDLSAALTVQGDPVELSPGLDLAAYRIAQEGLTNALRHSGARHATVTLRWSPTHLDVEVEDDGRGVPAEPTNGGHGLVGIRERVALYGGTVRLEPATGGGTRLAATLPLEGPRMTRIVICDDQGMVRAGFKSLLESEPDLEVVGEASNGQEAVDIVTLARSPT